MNRLLAIASIFLLLNNTSHAHHTESFTKEKECLALNIYFEARNQSYHGRKGVAMVVLNRVKDKRWPNNICDVVWQKYQFSWTHDGKSDNPAEEEVYKDILKFAEQILMNSSNFNDITNGSTHYHATWMKSYPNWSNSLQQATIIDEHVFYK